MQEVHFRARLFLAIALVATVVVLPGCKGSPDEDMVTADIPGATEEGEELPTMIELPQTNASIGITLTAAPEGLVATYNGESWIELCERKRPNVFYTFVVNTEQTPGVTAETVAEFETGILAYSDGEITGGGATKTALGSATWASGSYSEDGEILEMIYFLVPHPSGTGNLILTSVCPQNVSSVEERLERMRQLLKNVS